MGQGRFGMAYARWWLAGVAIAVVMGCMPAAAFPFGELAEDASNDYPFGWSASRLSVGGTQQKIFVHYDHGAPGETCDFAGEPRDNLDEPLRAFRFKNANGEFRVQTNFPRSPQNRRMLGTELNEVRREHVMIPAQERRACPNNIVFDGFHPPIDWRTFDDDEWVSTPYYVPGDPAVPNSGGVFAPLHQEARNLDEESVAGGCTPENRAQKCWFGSITFARSSTDLNQCNWSIGPHPAPSTTSVNLLGACFTHNPAISDPSMPPSELGKHIIGTIPYPFVPLWDRHGYSENTNIIRGEGILDGHYYMLARVSGPSWGAQEPGLCLLRAEDGVLPSGEPTLADPAQWKAWDGQSFAFHPESSENLTGPADQRLCKPVAPGMQPWSLTRNTYLDKYMLVGQSGQFGPYGVYYRLSDDLVNWSEPQLIVEAPNRDQALSACKDGISYPVILDDEDPASEWPAAGAQGNPNFDHPGAKPDLWFNHKDVEPAPSCGAPAGENPNGANVARMPLDLRWQRRATLETGLVDSATGFDSHAGTYFAHVGGESGDYDTSGYALANTWHGISTPYAYGEIGTQGWTDTDDVWYGAAFNLPADFTAVNNGTVHVLRWEGSTGFGGLMMRGATKNFRLVRGTAGGGWTAFGPAFKLPLGRWTWIEIHQRLGITGGGGTVTEVYADGRLVAASTDANRVATDTAPASKVRYGFVSNSSTSGLSSMGLDRASVLGGQRGAIGAPITPVGLRAAPGSGSATVSWNPVTAGLAPDGYRVYRQQLVGGAWTAWQPFGNWDSNDATPAVPNALSGTSVSVACDSSFRYRVTSYRQASAPRHQTDPDGASAGPDPQGAESVVSTPIQGPSC